MTGQKLDVWCGLTSLTFSPSCVTAMQAWPQKTWKQTTFNHLTLQSSEKKCDTFPFLWQTTFFTIVSIAHWDFPSCDLQFEMNECLYMEIFH